MKFRFVIALLAGALLVNACAAKDSSASDSVAAATGASARAATASAATPAKPQWKLGTDYFLITPTLPTGSEQVVVTEVFSYACPHCAHFQPWADKIKASLPAGVVMNYKPAVFHKSWVPFAKAFYVAKALGVLDQSHQALFDALHRDHKPIRTLADLATFYSAYGVDPQAFLSTAESFMVQTRMTKGMEWEREAGVRGTPTIIVNGTYRVDSGMHGGYPAMLKLVDWLVNKELAAKHDAA